MLPAMQNGRRIEFVLDTDTVTYLQRGRPAVVRRIGRVDPDAVATTSVTLYEQLRGRLAAINRDQGDTALVLAYERLQATHRYFCRVRVLPFDADAVDMYRRLINARVRVGAQDLKIAAITLAHGATLVTSNRRDFDQIAGLSIEDWNAEL